MNPRDVRTVSSAIKLGIFTLVSIVVTGSLAIIMGHLGAGSGATYDAVFVNASELKKGDDVRIAGVSVGSVKGVSIVHDDQALVRFEIDKDVPMTTASGVQIRYLNLVGDRYLALTQGTPGAPPLRSGATIPVSRTTPALNLTELFNGFQPLFQALNPADVNKLSLNLIRTLQGEGGSIASLLAQTADLTNSLADRDQLIGEVIGNLTTTLSTVDAHHTQLADLLTELNGWMGQLANDKDSIGTSIHDVSDLTQQLAKLLVDIRPATKADIAQLRQIAEILNRPGNQQVMDETLKRLPSTLRAQARIGTHGSWYDYYLCDFTGRIVLPSLGKTLDNSPAIKALQASLDTLNMYSTAKRCDL